MAGTLIPQLLDEAGNHFAAGWCTTSHANALTMPLSCFSVLNAAKSHQARCHLCQLPTARRGMNGKAYGRVCIRNVYTHRQEGGERCQSERRLYTLKGTGSRLAGPGWLTPVQCLSRLQFDSQVTLPSHSFRPWISKHIHDQPVQRGNRRSSSMPGASPKFSSTGHVQQVALACLLHRSVACSHPVKVYSKSISESKYSTSGITRDQS
jgi:hypothetical protein